VNRLLPWSDNWRVWLFTGIAVAYFAAGKPGFEPRLALGPLSLNQALQVAVLATLAIALARGSLRTALRRRTVWLAAALVALLAAGLPRTTNLEYAAGKTLGLAAVVLPCLVLLASRKDDPSVRRVLGFWMILGGGMMLLGLAGVLAGGSPMRLAVLGGGANVYARMVASSLLIAIGVFGLAAPGAGRALRWILVACFAAALLFAGSKAVVLALGVALATRAAYLHRPRAASLMLVATLTFALLPVLTHSLVQHRPKDLGTVRMFRLPDTDDPQGSYGTRTRYYRQSAELIAEQGLLGVGTGNWGPRLDLGPGRNYPHNALLELWCEQGIAGALLAFSVGAWTLHLLRRAWSRGDDRDLVATLAATTVFWMANAQLSGDLIDNRNVWWPLLGLEMVLARPPRRESPAGVVDSASPVRQDPRSALEPLVPVPQPSLARAPMPAPQASLSAR
jgi:hypothetical protein